MFASSHLSCVTRCYQSIRLIPSRGPVCFRFVPLANFHSHTCLCDLLAVINRLTRLAILRRGTSWPVGPNSPRQKKAESVLRTSTVVSSWCMYRAARCTHLRSPAWKLDPLAPSKPATQHQTPRSARRQTEDWTRLRSTRTFCARLSHQLQASRSIHGTAFDIIFFGESGISFKRCQRRTRLTNLKFLSGKHAVDRLLRKADFG